MHGIDYTISSYKPLISWSICSRTSSSIICPHVRHHRGSGAAQEPDRVKSFFCTCMTQRLCIHHPVHLWSLFLWKWPPPSCWWSLGCVFFLIVYLQAARQSTKKHSVRWLGSIFFLPAHMFFLLYGCIFGFLLPCQHVLCIRLYVLQFTGLYFVQLSGLLITSILSLKCNYVHHVMFLVERHRRLGVIPRLWQSSHWWKTKTCSEDGWQRLAAFLITTEKNVILTSVLSRNLHIKGKCLDNLCMTGISAPQNVVYWLLWTFCFSVSIGTSLLLHQHKHRNTICTLQSLIVYSIFAANIPTRTSGKT